MCEQRKGPEERRHKEWQEVVKTKGPNMWPHEEAE